MSVAGRLTIFTLVLIVLAVAGYFGYQYRDDISDFVSSLVGENANDIAATTEDEAAADEAAPASPDAAADTAAPTEEPVVLGPATAYFYEEPNVDSPEAPKHEASITWGLGTDPNTGVAVITANIAVPDEGLQVAMRISKSDDPAFSHEISVLVTQDAAHAGDPLAGVDNIAVKSSEEAIGAALVGQSFNDPDFFLLELPVSDQILNANRLALSPWFDLNIAFASGRRAILSFSKGEEGTPIFEQAAEAWAN